VKVVLASLGVLGVLGTSPALAGTAEQGERARTGRRGQGLVDYLGLSEEQQASWRAAAEQQRAEMEPFREEGRELRRRLREAVEAENPDPTAVGEARLALEEHHKKMRASREAFDTRLKALLSAEQKEKFEAFKAARRAGRGGREGRRHHRDRGQGGAPPVEG
jgi:Spy/CpxP family protein refolding chaperone